MAVPPARVGPPEPPRPPLVNWEFLVGVNWLAVIGAVAFVIGAGFFFRLAVDKGWISEAARVVLGGLVGVAFVAAGELFHRRYKPWSQAVSGAGFAIMYLALFAAFARYELIESVPALVLFSVVTVAAGAASLRYNSMGTAILGIVGGFATPLMLHDDLPSAKLLLAYVLVLDVGILALASLRGWRWLTLLGLLGSLADYGLWAAEFDPRDHLTLAQVGITCIYLLFLGATNLPSLLRRRAPSASDYALMVLNVGAYFGISYGQMWGELRDAMGGFTLALAAFYAVLGSASLIEEKAPSPLAAMNLSIAVVLLTIFFPVQFGGPWLSVAWAAEGAVAVWLSFHLRMPSLRVLGLGALGVAVGWLAAVDTPEALDRDLTPFANQYLPEFLLVSAGFFAAAWLIHRYQDALERWERQAVFPALVIGGSVVLTLAMPVQIDGVWITVAWAIEALALMTGGLLLRVRELRWCSLGVFAVMAGRLLFVDTVDAFDSDLAPFWNEFMWPFGIATGVTYLAAWLLHRFRARLELWEGVVFSVLIVGGSVLLTVALPVQAEGVWMTVAWAIEALALMTAGVFLGVRELRWCSLGVFVVATGRLLFVDTPDALDRTFDPFWNEFTVAYGAVIGGVYAAAGLVRAAGSRLDAWEWRLYPVLAAAGSVLMMVLMPVQTHGPWIPFAWVLQAAALLVVALWLGIEPLRWLSLAVFGAALLRLVALDTPVDLEDYRPILNLRMLGFASAVASMYAAAFLLWKRRGDVPEAVSAVAALVVAANFLTIYVLSAEIIATVDSGRVDIDGDAARNAKSLGLSLLWGTYGIVALTAGIVRGSRPLRQGGLGLLAVPVLKLFLYDSFELETGYRVAAFLVLGVILLAGGFLYQRYGGAIKGFLFETSPHPPSQSVR